MARRHHQLRRIIRIGRLLDPRADDVALIVEVADSTYTRDRGKMWQLYAAAGFLYFLINRALAAAGNYAERRMAWGRA